MIVLTLGKKPETVYKRSKYDSRKLFLKVIVIYYTIYILGGQFNIQLHYIKGPKTGGYPGLRSPQFYYGSSIDIVLPSLVFLTRIFWGMLSSSLSTWEMIPTRRFPSVS